jgi:hypothetical protein
MTLCRIPVKDRIEIFGIFALLFAAENRIVAAETGCIACNTSVVEGVLRDAVSRTRRKCAIVDRFDSRTEVFEPVLDVQPVPPRARMEGACNRGRRRAEAAERICKTVFAS